MAKDFSRRRDLMHKSHLDEFSRYLISCGWVLGHTYEYEVIRATKDGKMLFVWQKLNAKEHLTIQGESARLFHEWRNSKGQDKDNTDETRAEVRERGPK